MKVDRVLETFIHCFKKKKKRMSWYPPAPKLQILSPYLKVILLKNKSDALDLSVGPSHSENAFC